MGGWDGRAGGGKRSDWATFGDFTSSEKEGGRDWAGFEGGGMAHEGISDWAEIEAG